MPRGPSNEMAKGMVLIAAALLALVAFGAGPVGLRLAVDGKGMSFQMKAAFVKIAFEIGQACSETDSGVPA